MRDGLSCLGKQWDEPGPHGIVRIADEFDVQDRRRRTIHVVEDKARWKADIPVTHLDPKKVLPTQEFLYRGNHDSVAKADPAELPPVDVVQYGRTHYVVDGHHRWAAARAAGRPLPARVLRHEPRR